MQNFLQRGILDDFCECRIGLRGEETYVSVVAREFQVVRGAFGVAGLSVRLSDEEINKPGSVVVRCCTTVPPSPWRSKIVGSRASAFWNESIACGYCLSAK